MKFLTDENIATSVVRKLRRENFDVKDVKEEKLYGLSDRKIIEMAIEEDRIIITHDRNFGNVTNNRNTEHKGIILIRCKNQSPENVSKILITLLKSEVKSKIENSLTTISEEEIHINQNK